MAAGDVAISQNGGQESVKLQPHVLALIRWCMSCVWSAASELLQRLMAAPLPPLTAALTRRGATHRGRGRTRAKPPPDGATEHISPVPKVECVVLHQPQEWNMDFVFVHGLYGSLGNTWRQGDWKPKYKWGPNRVPIKRTSSIPTACQDSTEKPPAPEHINNNYDFCICDHRAEINSDNNILNEEDNSDKNNSNENDNNNSDKNNSNDNSDKNNLNEKDNSDKNISDVNRRETMETSRTNSNTHFVNDLYLGKEEFFERHYQKHAYEKDFMESVDIIDNYEAQAKFVRDLFRRGDCGMNCDTDEENCDEGDDNDNDDNDNDDDDDKIIFDNDDNKTDANKPFECDKCNADSTENQCACDKCRHKFDSEKTCPVGCGCVCEKCYSTCWPKDWLCVDHPDARIISINYTSDPYLWRPIWIKESKRLHLHERADQMTSQLLDLRVGDRPIIWVGHSKGGLFIKQIYADAYEAYKKSNSEHTHDKHTETENDNNDNKYLITNNNFHTEKEDNREDIAYGNSKFEKSDDDPDGGAKDNTYEEQCILAEKKLTNLVSAIEMKLENNLEALSEENSIQQTNNLIENLQYILENRKNNEMSNELKNDGTNHDELRHSAGDIDDIDDERRASLWTKSTGFMFYSVPHRGSSLADIKLAPLMLRSVELLEISKDCSLVLGLQERWLKATENSKPVVRSLVETCRTLMSVLWLRIVSVESADAGIGALCGVSVDHREICKPSSRSCLLYTELLNLVHSALDRCRCK